MLLSSQTNQRAFRGMQQSCTMDEIEPKHLEEVLQTLEEELTKMDPAELRALEEEIANESVASAQMEEIQQLTPEERDFFHKRLAQELAELKPIFEKRHKQEAEKRKTGLLHLKQKAHTHSKKCKTVHSC